MYGYVYKITNLVNGRVYVGQHKYDKYPNIDKNYFSSGLYIRRALKKYGRNNFKIEILEWCENKEKLNERELYLTFKEKGFIKQGGYVFRAGHEGIMEVSEETKIRMKNSKSHISEETRKRMSDAQKGKHLTENQKKAISKRMMGNTIMKGRKMSEESRKRYSLSKIGNKNSKGKIISEKQREEHRKFMLEYWRKKKELKNAD